MPKGHQEERKYVVEKIVLTDEHGKPLPHGPYAVARPLEGDRETVTFSLVSKRRVRGKRVPIWQHGKTWPRKGDVVVLRDVRERPDGLQANFARFP